MPLLKNPEFVQSDPESRHIRIGRVNFRSNSPVITSPTMKLAVYKGIQDGFTDDIKAIGVDLKRRPKERFGFDVVSECPTEELASLLTLGLPMQAMRSAGIELDKIELLDDPSLVSGAGEAASVEDMLAMYDTLRIVAGGLATRRQTETAPTPILMQQPAQIVVSRVLPAYAQAA